MERAAFFKTAEDETEYLAGYDATLALWPVPYEEVEVTGRFGATHVVTCGPEEAPPLVLLHGYMGTLLMWLPNVADLATKHRLYAIDLMGHPSKSIPSEPIRSADDFQVWLRETLNGLGLDRADVVGLSYGGWLGLGLAIKAPERVRKLVLLAPAASLRPISKGFTVRAMLTILYPRSYWFRSLMRWMGLDERTATLEGRHVLQLMFLGRLFRMPKETRMVMPTVYADDELRALTTPTLLLIGENEVIYSATEALDRAQRLIPGVTGELVPRCSHDITMTQNHVVDSRILEFLSSEEPGVPE
jgi:pimeloyl-ACP methyl ester carboxylesterase